MPWIIGGALLGGSIYSAERAKDASDAQMSFQASQSAGAVQTRTRDLRAAGINPILAAGQAATPMSGAQPQRFADPASAVQGFQEAKINKETVKLLKEQQMNVFRDTEKKQWEARAQEEFSLKTAQERKTEEWLTKNAHTAFDIAQRDRDLAWYDQQFYRTPEGKTMRNVQRIGESFAPGASALQNLFRFRYGR